MSGYTYSDFEAIYRQHIDFVWRTLRLCGVPPAMLEDAAHEVFIVVHRKLPEYDGRAAMKTWIYGVTRRIAANWRRSVERAERRHEQAPPPQAMPTPEEGVRRREAGELLERFLSTLDAPAREAFYLSQVEGLRAREVAELVDANINTVNTRIRTARIRFEKFVAERQSTPRTEIRAHVCRA